MHNRIPMTATTLAVLLALGLSGCGDSQAETTGLSPTEQFITTDRARSTPGPVENNAPAAMTVIAGDNEADMVRDAVTNKGKSLTLKDGSILVYGDDLKTIAKGPDAEPLERHAAYLMIRRNELIDELPVPDDAPAASSSILSGNTANAATVYNDHVLAVISAVEGHEIGTSTSAIYQYSLNADAQPKELLRSDKRIEDLKVVGNTLRYQLATGEWKSRKI
jgi:hypothetical protein